MKFEWISDDRKPPMTSAYVYTDNGKYLNFGIIYDCTGDKNIRYAYNIHGFSSMPASCLAEACRLHGLALGDYADLGDNAFGIRRNDEEWFYSPYNISGPNRGELPRSLEDVKDIVEEAFCNSLRFNYEAELEELNRRKALMDEAKDYLENKSKPEPEEEYEKT